MKKWIYFTVFLLIVSCRGEKNDSYLTYGKALHYFKSIEEICNHDGGKLWGKNSFLKRPGVITMSIGVPLETAGLKADEINQRVEAWIEAEVERLG